LKTLNIHISKHILIALFTLATINVWGQDNADIRLANEYYSQGEFEKAIKLYEDLAKDYRNIPVIHNNYYFLLLEYENFNAAEKYISKLIKKFPNNLYYELDLGLMYIKRGDLKQADAYFNDIIETIKGDAYKTRISAQYFVSNELSEYAIKTFLDARKVMNNPYVYSLELANIYRIVNEKDLMVNE